MKYSIYNFVIRVKEPGWYVIYNSLSGAVAIADEEAMQDIKNVRSTDPNRSAELLKEGIWVADDVNENAVLKVNQDYTKYSRKCAKFTILTTYSCNLSCTYCYQKYTLRQENDIFNKHMDSNASDRAIKFMKNVMEGGRYEELLIQFSGGEPLSNLPQVLKILGSMGQWSKEKNSRLITSMITNGTLLKEETVRKLAEYRMCFHVTLDGVKEVHDKRRFYKSGNGTYDDIITNLQTVVRHNLPIYIRVNVDRENWNRIGLFLDDIEMRLGKNIWLNFMITLRGAADDKCVYATTSCFEDKDFQIIPKLWIMAAKKGFKVLLRPLINFVYCQYLTNYAYLIDPSADVYKCEGLAGVSDHKMGTIDGEGKMVPTAKYYELMSRDPLTFSECSNCNLLPACGGGCPALAYDKFGTYNKAFCLSIKHVLEQQVKYQLWKKDPEKFAKEIEF
jgi:uncharacterized protein